MIAPKTLRTSFFLQRATALQGFDLSIARAVAEMRTLVELSLPLVKVGGQLIAAKGPNPQVVASLHELTSRISKLCQHCQRGSAHLSFHLCRLR